MKNKMREELLSLIKETKNLRELIAEIQQKYPLITEAQIERAVLRLYKEGYISIQLTEKDIGLEVQDDKGE